jgi:hypothetical protein
VIAQEICSLTEMRFDKFVRLQTKLDSEFALSTGSRLILILAVPVRSLLRSKSRETSGT